MREVRSTHPPGTVPVVSWGQTSSKERAKEGWRCPASGLFRVGLITSTQNFPSVTPRTVRHERLNDTLKPKKSTKRARHQAVQIAARG